MLLSSVSVYETSPRDVLFVLLRYYVCYSVAWGGLYVLWGYSEETIIRSRAFFISCKNDLQTKSPENAWIWLSILQAHAWYTRMRIATWPIFKFHLRSTQEGSLTATTQHKLYSKKLWVANTTWYVSCCHCTSDAATTVSAVMPLCFYSIKPTGASEGPALGREWLPLRKLIAAFFTTFFARALLY